MKKIVLIASMILAFTGISFAQTTPATPPAKKAKTTKTAPATTATPAAGPTKKDGTADMRFKANKDAAKTPPAHVKKDGTADKRYKENKPKKTT